MANRPPVAGAVEQVVVEVVVLVVAARVVVVVVAYSVRKFPVAYACLTGRDIL